MYGSTTQNYAELMSMARQNADDAKRRAKNSNLLPELSRPKKADPKQVKLKEGVAKFLAKREEEDKKKKEEEKEKKERLLQLRNQDRKAQNRVRKMLSMTKSANKSCVDDAKDSLNASIAAQGEFQPDEDDYGYTSCYADMMHKKMMEKYKNIPVKPVFSNSESKVPVPKHQSLQKNGSGWRNKNNEDNSYSPEQDIYEEPVPSRKPEKSAKVPPKPAPPDYRQLLQLAQQKQLEPVLPSKPIIDKKGEREEFEYGRPMTAKEKAAFLAEKELKERSAKRFEHYSADKNNNSSSDARSSKPSVSFKIPKAKTASKEDVTPAVSASPPKKPRLAEPESQKPSRENSRPLDAKQNSIPNHSQSSQRPNLPQSKPNGLKPASSTNTQPPRAIEKPAKPQNFSNSSPPSSSKKDHRPSEPPKPERSIEKRIPDKMDLIKQKPKYLSAFEGGKDRERDRDQMRKAPVEKSSRPGSSRDSVQGRDSRPMDARDKPRKMPNDLDKKAMRRDVSPPPPPPPRRDNVQSAPRRDMPPPMSQSRREMPLKAPPRMRDEPPRMKPKPHRGRAIIDSDEEYDSEMDDFIDDSEVDMGNISAEISRIFNYDRRKFDYAEESDDECMESSVAEQLREEQRSLRIGIQEDLEDIRREEEEKKRKLMKMKKMRR